MGNELLFGETVDTNAAWLGRELAAEGIEIERRSTVGDEERAIRDAVSAGLEHADLVLVTGGLGPTVDDVTRPAVAALLDAPLAVDEILLAHLEERFRQAGFPEMPPGNRSQAEVPRGARVLRNPKGTAPGLAIPCDGKVVVLLPGVPREMKAIVKGDLRFVLQDMFGSGRSPVQHRCIHTTGVAESELARRIDELDLITGPVRLAFLPDLRGVDLRLTVAGLDAGEATEWLDRVEEQLGPAVEGFRFEAEGGDVVEAVSRVLKATGRRLASAESCTGGLVAKRMTELAGASEVFMGGVVAYHDFVKQEMLGVDPKVLRQQGAVSEAVAAQMAMGVRQALGAEAGIGITGIAGPGGGSDEKPVGLVWIAVAVDDEVVVERRVFPGGREAIRERAAQSSLHLMLRLLDSVS